MSSPDQLLPQHLASGRGNASENISQREGDGIVSISAVESKKPLPEHLQHSSLGTMDDHLVEFSEELRTISKALRRVAEDKASAQEEAAKWKKKYELEKLRNLQLQRKVEGFPAEEEFDTCVVEKKLENLSEQSGNVKPSENQNGQCCVMHGICSQEILCRQACEHASGTGSKRCTRKASFTLAWGCVGEENIQHKHDVVSFESGNITTAVRSSKQITLKWDSPPQSVLILTKPNSNSVRALCAEMVRWLAEQRKVMIYLEPRMKKELVTETIYFDFVQTWEKDEEVLLLHTKVDLVITLGGDGTVLWAASLFKGPVPPVISFSMGSLGFMTPFTSDEYRDCLGTIMRGPVSITLRHRLQCHVLRYAENDERLIEEPILILNEVTIDRGMSPFLTYLECFCDNSFVTCVQGDGLILSTTSGSTAYSLAAGGSMVHPQVPSSLNSADCFLLQSGSSFFIWHGNSSSLEQQQLATRYADFLRPGVNLKHAKEGTETSAFWYALGGKQSYSSKREAQETSRDPHLYACTYEKGTLEVIEVFNFSQDDLLTEDIMILDTHSEVFVWVGQHVDIKQKQQAFEIGQKYMEQAALLEGLLPDIPLYKVTEGNEPSFFTKFFAWDSAKAAIQGNSFQKKLVTLQGIPIQAIENLKKQVSTTDAGLSESPTRSSDSSNGSKQSGPTQRASALAALSSAFGSSSGSKAAPRATKASISPSNQSSQRAAAVAALSTVLNAEPKRVSPTRTIVGGDKKPSTAGTASAVTNNTLRPQTEELPVKDGSTTQDETSLGESNSESKEVSEPNEFEAKQEENGNSDTYSYERLRTKSTNPAPGIDHKKRETYLSPEEFQKVFGMDQKTFSAQPKWKQDMRKKSVDLF